MERLTFINDLQDTLSFHDKALRQILQISAYIDDVNKQALLGSLSGQADNVMSLMLRKSVAEGVKRMYKQYRLQKWFQAQVMIHDYVKACEETGRETNVRLPEPDWYPVLYRPIVVDPTAETWATMQCQSSRYS